MKKLKLRNLALVGLAMLSTGVMANDIYVSSGGNNDNPGTKDAPVANFYWALQKIDKATGGNIYFSGTLKIDSVTKINRNHVVFIGISDNPAENVIDGQGKYSIFNMENLHNSFSVKNATLKNAFGSAVVVRGERFTSTKDDGTIVSADTARFYNCVFDSNVSDGSGGAIMNIRQNVECYNCTFTNNKSNAVGNLAGGGAIGTSDNSRTLIYKSYFEKNEAKANGGAAFLCGTGLVYYSKFVNNQTTGLSSNTSGGGAVGFFWNGQWEKLGLAEPEKHNVVGCSFYKNNSESCGGAINLNLAKFKNNVNILSSTFYENRARERGGAIEKRGTQVGSENTYNLINCTIVDNTIDDRTYIVDFTRDASGTNESPFNVLNNIIEGNYQQVDEETKRYNLDLNFDGNLTNNKIKLYNNIITYANTKNNNLVSQQDGTQYFSVGSDKEYERVSGIGEFNTEYLYFPINDLSLANGFGIDATEYGCEYDQFGTYIASLHAGSVSIDSDPTKPSLFDDDTIKVPSLTWDYTTGIEQVVVSKNLLNDGKIYNMAGQRVVRPIKGIYIMNGKKIFVNK
jgi:hypothetical protein